MGNKLYVGNLPFTSTEADLADMFSQCGNVDSVRLITDRDTGRSKGFAFVEMSTSAEAEESIARFGGTDLDGRSLTVNEARPKAPRQDGGDRSFGNRSDRY